MPAHVYPRAQLQSLLGNGTVGWRIGLYANLNRIVAKAIAAMTANMRFDGELNLELNEYISQT